MREQDKEKFNTLTPKWYVCVPLRLGSVIFSDPSSDYAYKVKIYTSQAIGGNVLIQLGSVTSRSATSTNERSRSGSRAYPTSLYNEAATLCFQAFLPSASKINISTKNSPHLRN
ncbi:hypothetical protein FHG87_015698 [Trinorchestia longiramus]|nr:hypothetical protein FHG87_015698 [Trinorchestia longiramus]